MSVHSRVVMPGGRMAERAGTAVLVDSRCDPPPAEVTADVCIVGAGPAGLTLATELAAAGAGVCVLESGGLEHDIAAADLNRGTTIDPPGATSPSFPEHRRRRMGGSAHCWDTGIPPVPHVRLVCPAPVDFEARAGRPETGWPFARDALIPYLRRAHQIFDAGPFSYEPEEWSLPAAPFPRDGTRLSMKGARYARSTVFTRDVRTRIAGSNRVNVILHATATRLRADEHGVRVTAIEASAPSGRSFAVRAGNYVLAAGGLENARVLLLSGRERRNSFGNGADLVGRYLMDHPNVVLGTLVPTHSVLGAWAAYDLQYVDGFPVRADLAVSDSLLRQEALANAVLTLTPRPRWRDSRALLAAARIVSSLRSGQLPSMGPEVLRDLVTRPGDLAVGAWYRGVRRVPQLWRAPWGWSRAGASARMLRGFTVRAQLEQLPDASNRVTLADELDPLGLPRMRVEWGLNELDLASITRLVQIVRNEVERSAVGIFTPAINADGCRFPEFWTSYHHMGTTRMHNDRLRGVVDPECRVHGITNLYVAGCSVFPTAAGYANPTLTIVALALRLAQHLQGELQG